MQRVETTKAKLVFAATTPYLENPGGPFRRVGEPQQYNSAALKIMRRRGVAINDLFRFVNERSDDFLAPNNVHVTKAGPLEVAKRVVWHIQHSLGM